MPLDVPGVGFHHAAEYLIPGTPWVTASLVNSGVIHEHDFWRVTRFVTVVNAHASFNLHVGFTRNGLFHPTASMYAEIPPKTALPMELAVKKIFIRGSGSGATPYSIVAGVVGVLPKDIPELTGTFSNGATAFHNVG